MSGNMKKQKAKEADYIQDDYNRLRLWLHRKHPDIIDDYEEEKGLKGDLLYT